LSEETVLNTLVSFGLSQIEAQIYIFLAKKGAQKGRDIRKALKITKQQLYPSLRDLQNKGIVSSTIEHPARFSALPFEKVLDLFIEAKVEETRRLQQSKDEILSKWQTFDIAETDTPRFMVIEGRNYIFSKIRQMIQETKNQIATITTVPSLVQADQYDLFYAGFSHPLKSKIKFRFLTELSSQNLKAMKNLLRETASAKLNFEGRNPDLGLRLFPRMVIRDEDEAIFFIRPRSGESIIERDDVCLWTNCKTLVKAFTAIFEELWRYSTDIQKKIVEIETGKPPPKVYSISNAETARKKYDEVMQIAKEEIILLTSPEGIIESWKNNALIKKLTERDVSIKIMAPVLRGNLKEAEQLSKFCAVRHVPINYWKTMIVDERYLLQFRASPPDQKKPETELLFEEAFYTEDLEYLKLMKKALDDIWKKAQALSTVRLESALQPFGPPVVPLPNEHVFERGHLTVIDFKPPGMITEKDILNKIIKAKKLHVKDISKDTSRMYASMAMAVIHLPEHLNLPKIMLQVAHVESWSSLGGGCYLVVLSWIETPAGNAFVPVAVLLPEGSTQVQAYFEMFFAGTPAAQNIQLVKNDELQVRVHGNTLFAGWTVPIQLFPPQRILQPGCLLVEGYGDVVTSGSTVVFPSGVKAEMEGNYFAALVTFMQPSYNYSGPGTEGFFARDYIMTKHPPQKREKTAKQSAEKNP
jgi:sugar-specific transcriptional regulator TrmB